ncbi:MAG: low molecular weight phosphotyrosine protein phosphatase [Holophagales bacterium]|nr:low molecular weight phosphotyrosine protein phosphatase [Holophagales bacterium]
MSETRSGVGAMGRDPRSDSDRRSVLFVCMGNICRSPAGEGLFRALVRERDLEDRFLADSAGTIAYHAGNAPDRRMSAAASRRGYELRGRARQIEVTDLERFDLIVAMDRQNLHDIEGLGALARERRREGGLRLLSEFLDGGPEDVPDPYYGGEAGFEQVLDMVEAACPRILEHLLDGDHS